MSVFEEIKGKVLEETVQRLKTSTLDTPASFFQKCVKQLISRSPRSGKCLTSLWEFSKLPENCSCQAPPEKRAI